MKWSPQHAVCKFKTYFLCIEFNIVITIIQPRAGVAETLSCFESEKCFTDSFYLYEDPRNMQTINNIICVKVFI